MIKRITKAIIFRLNRFYYRIGGGNNYYGVSILRRFQNFTVLGSNNTIVAKSRLPKDVKIFIYGCNHKLTIEPEVTFKRGVIWFEDNGCEIHIGTGTTIEDAKLAVADDRTRITIGRDCMISSNVHVVSTDSHSIIDCTTRLRINHSRDVVIEDHVWLGYCANINKGVTIGKDSIVASHSVVTKNVPTNSIVAGIPAKVVKNNVTWDRERIKNT